MRIIILLVQLLFSMVNVYMML